MALRSQASRLWLLLPREDHLVQWEDHHSLRVQKTLKYPWRSNFPQPAPPRPARPECHDRSAPAHRPHWPGRAAPAPWASACRRNGWSGHGDRCLATFQAILTEQDRLTKPCHRQARPILPPTDFVGCSGSMMTRPTPDVAQKAASPARNLRWLRIRRHGRSTGASTVRSCVARPSRAYPSSGSHA